MGEPGTALDREILERLMTQLGSEGPALVARYRQRLGDTAQGVEEARGRGDMGSIAAQAHALKSASAMFGAVRLSSTSEALEKAARGNREAEAADLSNRVVEECAQVADALDAWAAPSPPG